jgi:DNA modification methylase
MAAKTLGRQFIGLEVNPDYCKIAEQRIAQEVLEFV